jgi:hypothetical protein
MFWVLVDLIMFPLGSQCVLKNVPNITSLYPIAFALSSTFLTYICSPKGGDYITSIFWDCSKHDKVSFDEPINYAHHKRCIYIERTLGVPTTN